MPSIIGSSTISGNISTNASAAITGPTGNTGPIGPIGPTGATGITAGGTGGTGVWISSVSSDLVNDTITFTLNDGRIYGPFGGFVGPTGNYSNSGATSTITGFAYDNPLKGVCFGVTFEFRGISASGNIVSELSPDGTEILLKINNTLGSAATPSQITSGYLIYADDEYTALASGIGITGSNNYLTFGLPRSGETAERVSLYVDVEQKIKTISSLAETAPTTSTDDVVIGKDSGGYILDLKKYSAYNISTPVGITSFIADNIPGTIQSWTFFINGADVWNLPNNLYFDNNIDGGLGRAGFLKGTNILNVWTSNGGITYYGSFAARGIGYSGNQYTTNIGSCCYTQSGGLTCADYVTPDFCESKNGAFSALTDCSRSCVDLGYCCINQTCYNGLPKSVCDNLAGVWNKNTCPSGCAQLNIFQTATVETKGASEVILIPREAQTDHIAEITVVSKPNRPDAIVFKLIKSDKTAFEAPSGAIANKLFYVVKNDDIATPFTGAQLYNGVPVGDGDVLKLYVKTDSGIFSGIQELDSGDFSFLLIENSNATIQKYLPIITNPNACTECFDTQYIQTTVLATNKCYDCVNIEKDQSDNIKSTDYPPLQVTDASISLCVTTNPNKFNWNGKPYKINCIRGLTAVNTNDCSQTYWNANNSGNPPELTPGVTFCKHIKYKNILPPDRRSEPGLDCGSTITLSDGTVFDCANAIRYSDNGQDVVHCKGNEDVPDPGDLSGITAYFTELGGMFKARLQTELPQGVTLNEVLGDILGYLEGLTVGSTSTKFLFTWEGHDHYIPLDAAELNSVRKCCTASEIYTGDYAPDKYNQMANLCDYSWSDIYFTNLDPTANLKYAEQQVLNLGAENPGGGTQTYTFYNNGSSIPAPTPFPNASSIKDIKMGSGWVAALDNTGKITVRPLVSSPSTAMNTFINSVNNVGNTFGSISAGPNFLVGIQTPGYNLRTWAITGTFGVTAPSGATGIAIFNNNMFFSVNSNDAGTAKTVYIKEKRSTSSSWITRGLAGWGGNSSTTNQNNISNGNSTFLDSTIMPSYLQIRPISKTTPERESVPEPNYKPITLVAFTGDNADTTYLAYVPGATLDGESRCLFVWPPLSTPTSGFARNVPPGLSAAANLGNLLDVKAGRNFFIGLTREGMKNKVYVWGAWGAVGTIINSNVSSIVNDINNRPFSYPEQIGVGPGDPRAWVVMNDGEVISIYDSAQTNIILPANSAPSGATPRVEPNNTRKIITGGSSNSVMLETTPQADQYEYWLYGQFASTHNLCRTPYICEGECGDGNRGGPCIGDDAEEQILEGYSTKASNTFILLRVEVNPDGTLKDPQTPGCLITLPGQYYGDGFEAKANAIITNLNKGCTIKYSSPNFRCTDSGKPGGLNPEPDNLQTNFTYLGRIRKNQLRNPVTNANGDIIGNLDFSPSQYNSTNPRNFCWWSHCPGGPKTRRDPDSCYGCYPCFPNTSTNYMVPNPVYFFAQGWGLLNRPYGFPATPPLFVDTSEFSFTPTDPQKLETERIMFQKEYIFDKTYSKFLCKTFAFKPGDPIPVICDSTASAQNSCNEHQNNQLYWNNTINHNLVWPTQCTQEVFSNHDNFDVKIVFNKGYDSAVGLTAITPTVFRIDKTNYTTRVANDDWLYYLDGITAHEPQLVKSGDKVYVQSITGYNGQSIYDPAQTVLPMDQTLHFFYINGKNTPFSSQQKLIKNHTSYTYREEDKGKALYTDDVGIPVTDTIIQEYTADPNIGFLDSTIKLDFKTIYSKGSAVLNLISKNEKAGMITSGDIVTLDNNIKIQYILWQPRDATGSGNTNNKYEIDTTIDTAFDTPIQTRHDYNQKYIEIKTKDLFPADGIDFSGNLLINGIVQLEYTVNCITSVGNVYYNQPRTAVLYLNRKKNFDNVRTGRLSCLNVDGTCIQVNCTDPLNEDICRKYRWCDAQGGCV